MRTHDALILTVILVGSGKALGFLRDLVIALVYGATGATDAYFVASTVPSLFLMAFYSTIPLAFMPLYIERLREGNGANGYANVMLWIYVGISLAITVLTAFLAPVFVNFLAPEMAITDKALAIDIVRIFSLSFVFSVACAYFSTIQYAHDIRLGQQLSPVINHTIFIAVVGALGLQYDIRFAAAAAAAAWAVQLPLQYWLTRRKFYFERPHFDCSHDFAKLIRFSGPIFLTLFIEQGLMAGAVYFASSLEKGTVSIVTYAYRLANLPLTLATLLITIYVYPQMNRLANDADRPAFDRYVTRISGVMVMLVVPMVLICWFEGTTITRIIFSQTRLDTEEIAVLGMVFSTYMISVLLLVLRELANRCFYARQKGLTVMMLTALLVLSSFGFSAVLVPIHGAVGIPLGAAGAAMITCIAQALVLRRVFTLHWSQARPLLVRIVLGGIIMTVLLYIGERGLSPDALGAHVGVMLGAILLYGALTFTSVRQLFAKVP